MRLGWGLECARVAGRRGRGRQRFVHLGPQVIRGVLQTPLLGHRNGTLLAHTQGCPPLRGQSDPTPRRVVGKVVTSATPAPFLKVCASPSPLHDRTTDLTMRCTSLGMAHSTAASQHLAHVGQYGRCGYGGGCGRGTLGSRRRSSGCGFARPLVCRPACWRV